MEKTKEYQMKGIYIFRYTKILKALNLDLQEIMTDVSKTLRQSSLNPKDTVKDSNDAVKEAKENPIGQLAVWGTILAKVVNEVIQNIDAVEKDLVSFMGVVSGNTKKEIEELNPEDFMDIIHWLFSGDNLKAFIRAWEQSMK